VRLARQDRCRGDGAGTRREVSLDLEQHTELRTVDDGFQGLYGRQKAPIVAESEDDIVARQASTAAFALSCVRVKGFSTKTALPERAEADNLLRMMAVGRREHDGIDGWILERALQVAIDCQSVLSGKGSDSVRRPRDNCAEADAIASSLNRSHQSLSPIAGADNRCVDHLNGVVADRSSRPVVADTIRW